MILLRSRALTPETGLGDVIEDIARLRIDVFREWPYLYDGSLDYERTYMRKFATAQGAVAVVAFDGDKVVGASTGMPLIEADPDFQAPFADAGMPLERIFYCAESVLRAPYRGQGLYRAFFDGRESHARKLGGFATSTFCAVVRPDDHPLRPPEATSLAPVWRHFGYTPRPDLACRFAWKDVGQESSTEKTLIFWKKDISEPSAIETSTTRV